VQPVPALLKANRLVAGLRLAFDRVGALETVVPMRGTEGSNLAPSSAASRANLSSGSDRRNPPIDGVKVGLAHAVLPPAVLS